MTAAPLFLFAPGAGAPSSSPWMRRFQGYLEQMGKVTPFDYAYQRAGRRTPDRLPKLIEAHCEALAQARVGCQGPVILVGKSMGGRVGCHVSLQEKVDALICFGYPLRSAGRNAKLRDEVLRQLTTPILFVQGTRDPLCPLELLEPLLDELGTPNELFVVETGDHSLQATRTHLKEKAITQQSIEREIMDAVADFVRRLG